MRGEVGGRALPCLLLVLVTGSTFGLHASATEPIKQPSDWSEIIPNDELLSEILGKTGSGLSQLLFRELEGLGIWSQDFGDGSVDFKLGRAVYDNLDSVGSWTVLDKILIRGQIPIFEATTPGLGTGAPEIGFSLGSEAGIEFVDIRQVFPDQLPSLPSIEDEKKRIEATKWYQDFIRGQSKSDAELGQWTMTTDPTSGNNFLTFAPPIDFKPDPEDPRTKVWLSRFWNAAIFPFRLPLNAEAVQKMEPYEVISYAGSGKIELGGSVGWSLDPSGIVGGAKAGVEIVTYLEGKYRLSVLKENDRFVRIKATRIWESGTSGSVGSELGLVNLNGIFLVSKLKKDVEIIPFKLTVKRKYAESFDIGYRYDLDNPHGREAYELGVMGRLALSDQLSIGEVGVQKIFTRTTDTDGSGLARQLKLTVLYQRKSDCNYTFANTIITDPEGTHHQFKAVVENTRQWNLFWLYFEKFKHIFSVHLNADQYESDPDCTNCLNLVAEGFIADTFTNKPEMLQYILEVENSVGQFGVYPRPPSHAIAVTKQVLFDHLGRSSFYYRIGLTQTQVNKFLHVESSAKWPMLEAAFDVPAGSWSGSWERLKWRLTRSPWMLLNIPLYVSEFTIRAGSQLEHAIRIKDRWDHIEDAPTMPEKIQSLGRLFFDRHYSYELVRLLRAALVDEEVAYTTNGYSEVFGKISKRGSTLLNPIDEATRRQREIDFDRDGPRPPDDAPENLVHQLYLKRATPTQYKLSFVLESDPQALFLTVSRIRHNFWGGKKKLAQAIIRNNGQLHRGENTILISTEDPEHPLFPVIEKLDGNKGYALRAALTNDGLRWGKVSTYEFVNSDPDR